MPVFQTVTRRLSPEEIEEHRLRQKDTRWWAQQPIEPYIGKYVAVVNCEAFVGATWEEAEQQAQAKYPHRRPVVRYVPHVKGPRIL